MAISDHAILTARHVIEDAIGPDSGLVVRIVRTGIPEQRAPAWTPAIVVWQDSDWDIAILVARETDDSWRPPASLRPIMVELGSQVADNCEIVGFPDEAMLPLADHSVLRQSVTLVGRLLPASHARGSEPNRESARRHVPFDIVTDRPDRRAGWSGISGAGVITSDGRLAGIVVTTSREDRTNQLYTVMLSDVVSQSASFVDSLNMHAAGWKLEVLEAPRNRRLFSRESLNQYGMPVTLTEGTELRSFGVNTRRSDAADVGSTYVPRTDDGKLVAAIQAEVNSPVELRRMVLVVGDSASGKTRSLLEAARKALHGRSVYKPQSGFQSLQEIANLPAADLRDRVVWLDDLERYAHSSFGEVIRRIIESDAYVLATMRRAQYDSYRRIGDIRDPFSDALTDAELVAFLAWRLDWDAEEVARARRLIKSYEALKALGEGSPLGVWIVAGREIVQEYQRAKIDHGRPFRYAVMRVALDWFLAGMSRPISERSIGEVLAEATEDYFPSWWKGSLDGSAIEGEIEALAQPLFGSSHNSIFTVVDKQIFVHEYLRDWDAKSVSDKIPDSLWEAVSKEAAGYEKSHVSASALGLGNLSWAIRLQQDLAANGDTIAMLRISHMLNETDPAAAMDWLSKAADTGSVPAATQMGAFLIKRGRTSEAIKWLKSAASRDGLEAAVTLGTILVKGDPEAASEWLIGPAERGSVEAMLVLASALYRLNDFSGTEAWLEKAVAKGSRQAVRQLAALYRGVDHAKQRKWLLLASEQGDLGSMISLGRLVWDEDPELSEHWLQVAISKGSKDAQAHLGVQLLRTEPSRAMTLLERAAEKGPSMEFTIGSILQKAGYQESSNWFERSAENGFPPAMTLLGKRLIESDPARARVWLEKAAKKSFPEAQVLLSDLLAQSNPTYSRQLLTLAAQKGHTLAMLQLARVLPSRDAEKWIRKAAAKNNPDAIVRLAEITEETDPLYARDLWQRGVKMNNAAAMVGLARMEFEYDQERALALLVDAADLGNADAMQMLGRHYESIDADAAVRWYRLAAELGNIKAMAPLGMLLMDADASAAVRWLEEGAAAHDIDSIISLIPIYWGDSRDECETLLSFMARNGDMADILRVAKILEPLDPARAREWSELAHNGSRRKPRHRKRDRLASPATENHPVTPETPRTAP